MSDAHGPTADYIGGDEIRWHYARRCSSLSGDPVRFFEQAFDRWLAEHDRQVKASAWAEGRESIARDFLSPVVDGMREASVTPYRPGTEPNRPMKSLRVYCHRLATEPSDWIR
jgi:hypothetical protein